MQTKQLPTFEVGDLVMMLRDSLGVRKTNHVYRVTQADCDYYETNDKIAIRVTRITSIKKKARTHYLLREDAKKI